MPPPGQLITTRKQAAAARARARKLAAQKQARTRAFLSQATPDASWLARNPGLTRAPLTSVGGPAALDDKLRNEMLAWEQMRRQATLAQKRGQFVGRPVALAAAPRGALGSQLKGFAEEGTSALVGPSIASYLPGGKPRYFDPMSVALGAVSVLPVGRAGRGVTLGLGKAAKAAGLARTGKTLTTLGRGGRALYGTRQETWRGLTVPMPTSPSLITASIQHLAITPGAQKLGQVVDVLRESKSAVARAVGRGLTPISSRGRVVRQAGRLGAREIPRAKAALGPEIRTFRKQTKDPAVANAHFWWAQAPPGADPADVLQRVVSRYMADQTWWAAEAAGAFRTEKAAVLSKIKTAREAGNTEMVALYRGAYRKLNGEMRKIPERVRDIGAQIELTKQAIRDGVAPDAEFLDAMRAFSEERKGIMTAQRKLDPGRAAEREWLVSDYLGYSTPARTVSREVEAPTGQLDLLTGRGPTGQIEEIIPPIRPPGAAPIYVGHRPGKVPGTRPATVSTGKTRLPLGIKTRNELRLVKTGRVRTDVKTVYEDWMAALVYQSHRDTANELWQISENIGALGPKQGHVLINPQGEKIPQAWRRSDEAIDDITKLLEGDVEGYVRNTFAVVGSDDAARIMDFATKHGLPVRQIPYDAWARFVSRKIGPHRVSSYHPLLKDPNRFVEAMRAITDMTYASLIYTNIGYVPSNLAGNMAFAILDQGPFVVQNVSRALELQMGAHVGGGTERKRIWAQILGEVGHGATLALTSGGKNIVSRASRKATGVVAALPDNTLRGAAFLHEAAGAGVISRMNPYLSGDDIARLSELFQKGNRGKLNDISRAATQAMVDFQRLGPRETQLANTGVLFVWRWLRGAFAYPVEFAAAHPVRTAAMTAAGIRFEDEIKKNLTGEDAKPWLRQAAKMGETTVKGKTFERVLPTKPFSPIGTFAELAETLLARSDARRFGEFINPGFTALYDIGRGQDQYGRDIGYTEAAKAAGLRLAPDVRLAGELINPPKTPGFYPEDVTRLGRLKRAARVLPYAVSEEGLHVKTKGKTFTALQKFRQYMKDNPDVIPIEIRPQLESAYLMHEEFLKARQKFADDLGIHVGPTDASPKGGVQERQEYAIKLAILKQVRPDVVFKEFEDFYRQAFESKNEDMIDAAKDYINERMSYADVFGKSAFSVVDEIKKATKQTAEAASRPWGW